MSAEGELRIEEILGEIRTVMLSIPCPYCGKIPRKPVKPGETVKCSACGSYYKIENTLNETSKEALRKIVDQALQKYNRNLDDFEERITNKFLAYADEILHKMREFYEKNEQIPTKSDLENLLSEATSEIMNAIAHHIEEMSSRLGKKIEDLGLEIERVDGHVTSIKGDIKEILNLLRSFMSIAMPSLEKEKIIKEVKIIYINDKGQLRELLLPKGETIIGRNPESFEVQARTPEKTLNLGIFDVTISKRHLRIIYDEKNVYIEDLESTNGSYINGEKIESLKRYTVKDGDKIRLGALDTELEIRLIF